MTEQELIEKIAEEGVKLYAFPNIWQRLNGNEKNNWRNWAKSRILPIFKEAGYKSPEEARELSIWSVDDNREIDRDIWAKANGYVQLADDQTLPERTQICVRDNKLDKYVEIGHKAAQQDMLKGDSIGVWRKVKEEIW